MKVMKMKYCSLTAFTLLLTGFIHVKAESVVLFHPFDSEVLPQSVNIAEVKRIAFDTESFSVIDKALQPTATFAYADVKKISFNLDSSVKTLTQGDSKVKVTPNPVHDYLCVSGATDSYGKDLNVYAMTGNLVVSVPAWNGEPVNVADLPQGIYFVRINSITIKFIKL